MTAVFAGRRAAVRDEIAATLALARPLSQVLVNITVGTKQAAREAAGLRCSSSAASADLGGNQRAVVRYAATYEGLDGPVVDEVDADAVAARPRSSTTRSSAPAG